MKRAIFISLILAMVACGESGKAFVQDSPDFEPYRGCDHHVKARDSVAFNGCLRDAVSYLRDILNAQTHIVGEVKTTREGDELVIRWKECRFVDGKPLPAKIHERLCEFETARVKHGRGAAFKKGFWTGAGVTVLGALLWDKAKAFLGGAK